VKVITDVSPKDPFYRSDPVGYFEVGPSALHCIQTAMSAARRSEPKRILDFACGYGRVLRTLRAAFPEAQLVACDVNRDAVDFCAAAFGATAAYSHSEPEQVKLPGPFDLIWCGSLFTHLGRWDGFLRLLASASKPDGLLVFTTAGRHVIELMKAGDHGRIEDPEGLIRDYEETGFGYRPYPGEGLGLARSSPAWICRLLEERFPELRLVFFGERAWNALPASPDRQDVVACVHGAVSTPGQAGRTA
jgi:SAM-dependent methyltransferase